MWLFYGSEIDGSLYLPTPDRPLYALRHMQDVGGSQPRGALLNPGDDLVDTLEVGHDDDSQNRG
jgi:hypothetical protein